MYPYRYRLLVALVFVGGLLCLFAFQAIADGKKVDALESGLAGVAVTIRRTKRKWVDEHELTR